MAELEAHIKKGEKLIADKETALRKIENKLNATNSVDVDLAK